MAFSGRGTEIVLHLKEDAGEFLSESSLKSLIHRYSEFITFPIFQMVEKEEEVEVDDEEEDEDEEEDDKEKAAGEQLLLRTSLSIHVSRASHESSSGRPIGSGDRHVMGEVRSGVHGSGLVTLFQSDP